MVIFSTCILISSVELRRVRLRDERNIWCGQQVSPPGLRCCRRAKVRLCVRRTVAFEWLRPGWRPAPARDAGRTRTHANMAHRSSCRVNHEFQNAFFQHPAAKTIIFPPASMLFANTRAGMRDPAATWRHERWNYILCVERRRPIR